MEIMELAEELQLASTESIEVSSLSRQEISIEVLVHLLLDPIILYYWQEAIKKLGGGESSEGRAETEMSARQIKRAGGRRQKGGQEEGQEQGPVDYLKLVGISEEYLEQERLLGLQKGGLEV